MAKAATFWHVMDRNRAAVLCSVKKEDGEDGNHLPQSTSRLPQHLFLGFTYMKGLKQHLLDRQTLCYYIKKAHAARVLKSKEERRAAMGRCRRCHFPRNGQRWKSMAKAARIPSPSPREALLTLRWHTEAVYLYLFIFIKWLILDHTLGLMQRRVGICMACWMG